MCLGCWNDAVETDLGSSLQLCAYLHVMGGQQQAAVLWLRKWKLLPLRYLDILKLAFSSDKKHRIQGYRTWCNEELQIGNVSNFVAMLSWKWNKLGIRKGVRLAVKRRAMYIEEPKFVPIKLRFHDRNKFICKTLSIQFFHNTVYVLFATPNYLKQVIKKKSLHNAETESNIINLILLQWDRF